jgi:branched-chain amino acid transport system permease protein
MIESFLTSIIPSYYVSILTFISIFIILAISLDIVNGYTGQFSIGHAGFMAVGAYAAAYLTFYHSMNFFLATLAGAAAAAICGLVIGIPTLRLRGDYLAIATLGFAEIIRVLFLNLEVTGGPRGFSGIATETTLTAALVAALLSFVILYNLTRSRFGRSFMAIREDEIAAECVGVPTTNFKILAFVVAAFFAGIAGSLYAHYLSFLHPSDFGLLRSIEVLLMIVLGGMGNLFGAALGATVLSILPESLRSFEGIQATLIVIYLFAVLITYRKGVERSPLRYWLTIIAIFGLLLLGLNVWQATIVEKVNQLRMVIYSILLIVMMLFRPEGLLGSVRFRLPTRFGRAGDRDERAA